MLCYGCLFMKVADDGCNEGERNVWRQGFSGYQNTLTSRPGIHGLMDGYPALGG